MPNCLVSIIIPTYNSYETIAETVNSCLNQTWSKIEIIIVDDGSIDNTVEKVKAIQDDRIKLIKQDNKGACAARNFGLTFASGDYIQYLDADDIISLDKIENQLSLLKGYSPNTVASCEWVRFYNHIEDYKAAKSSLNKSYSNPLKWLVDSWNGKGMGQTSIWLTPISLIKKAGPWNEDLKVNQDGEFFARVLLHANEIIYCPEATVYYRSSNKNSISQAAFSEAKAESLYKSFCLYKQHVSLHLQNAQVRQALARNFAEIIYRFSDIFPEICASAWGQIEELNTSTFQSVGGSYFSTLSGIIGFKNAVALRNYTRNIIRTFNS